MYPFIQIGTTPIPTYLFVISLVYCICIFWTYKRAQKFNLSTRTAMDLCLIAMAAGLIGSRMFHVLYEVPSFYFEYPYEIFKLWKGGFVFYGGILFAFLSAALFLKVKKIPLGPWMDIFAPVIALGYGLGRIGCFFAGCCFGKYCNLPWAVHYPFGVEAPAHAPLHPTPVYATLYELTLLILLLWLEKNRNRFKAFQKMGSLFYFWMVLHGFGRLFNESLRNDLRGPQFFDYSISTWISFGLIFVGILFFMSRKVDDTSSDRAPKP